MSDKTIWLWLSLFAALSWGTGSVFLKPAYKRLASSQIFILNGVSFFTIWLIYKAVTAATFIFPKNILLFLPILSPIAFVVYVYALKKGKVSIVSAVSSASVIISTTLAILFLKEKISSIQIFSTVVMVITLIVLGLNERSSKNDSYYQGFLWGLISSIAFGIANTVNKFSLTHLGSVNFSIINSLWMILLGIIWLVINKKTNINNWIILKTHEGKLGLIGATAYSLGGFFLFLALQKGQVSLVMPVSNLSTPISMILALTFLKEKITTTQKVLILVIFLATTALSIF